VETLFNDIARAIKDNTNKTVGKVTSILGLELGTITSAGLKVDNFKYEAKDYMVLEHLKLQEQYTTEAAGVDVHSHNISTPSGLKPLTPGDRVLVATVGGDFVVIGRVTNA